MLPRIGQLCDDCVMRDDAQNVQATVQPQEPQDGRAAVQSESPRCVAPSGLRLVAAAPSGAPRAAGHVGVIMDGNGRWACRRGLPRRRGHEAGVTAARAVVEEACRLNLATLTLFFFSTENWRRPPEEVHFLMRLLSQKLEQNLEAFLEHNIKIRLLGDIEALGGALPVQLVNLCRRTDHCQGLELVLAINYGGRADIVRAVRGLASRACRGELAPSDITEESLAASLQTGGLPHLDLIIRTGGEKRVSNFLLWELAYSELLFSETLWPDYTPDEFRSGWHEFLSRQRRFGALQASRPGPIAGPMTCSMTGPIAGESLGQSSGQSLAPSSGPLSGHSPGNSHGGTPGGSVPEASERAVASRPPRPASSSSIQASWPLSAAPGAGTPCESEEPRPVPSSTPSF